MPYSINGIGTGLIEASRIRKNDGLTQYDAIEGEIFLHFPLVPHRALHILDIRADKKKYAASNYRFIPLRMSSRLILKAFLNGWGNCLTFIGAITLGIWIFGLSSLKGPNQAIANTILLVVILVLIVGVVCKIGWFYLIWKDETIKTIIGPHAWGHSDPWDWQPDLARTVTQLILQEESLPTLLEVARRAVQSGNRARAAFCLRLAMRDRNNVEAQDLLDRLIKESWWK